MIIFNRKHKCVYSWKKGDFRSLKEYPNFYYRPDGPYVYHNKQRAFYSFCQYRVDDVALRNLQINQIIIGYHNDFF